MKILLLSQVYWPDTVAVSQFVTDLCESLAKKEHQVDVWAGQFAYDNEKLKYKRFEKHQHVNIYRLPNTGYGKKSILFRLTDFFSFNFLIFIKLLFLKRQKYDLVIGVTVPPLLSFLGSLFASVKNYKFFYWTMDLQPELSISSGLLRKGSISANLLTKMGDFTFKHSDYIYVLDHYMKQHVISRGGNEDAISISPLWPIMEKVYEGERLENPFRKKFGFGDKMVIMYSGNHSYVHPVETLLLTALSLKDDDRFLFVFIGSGVRKKEVTDFKEKHNLENILQLPFQPRENIHNSLGASDIQVVIMGQEQVGFTHPNKIYGALFIGKPIVYIGPRPSHVQDVLEKINARNVSVAHGDVHTLKQALENFAEDNTLIEQIGNKNQTFAYDELLPERLREKMVEDVLSKYNILNKK